METSVIHHAGWFFFYVLRVLSVILYKVSINNVAHWNVFITEHNEYTNVYAARVRNPAGERIANLKVDIVVRNRKCNILNQEEARGWIIFLLLVCVCVRACVPDLVLDVAVSGGLLWKCLYLVCRITTSSIITQEQCCPHTSSTSQMHAFVFVSLSTCYLFIGRSLRFRVDIRDFESVFTCHFTFM